MNRLEKLKNIRLFMLDLEGTLISGSCAADLKNEDIEKLKKALSDFVSAAKKNGIRVAVITGRECDGFIADLSNLDVDMYSGTVDKTAPAENLLKKYGLTYEQAAYAGDDILDLPLLGKAGFKIAPSTARREVKRIADAVLGEPENLLIELTDMLYKAGSENPDAL